MRIPTWSHQPTWSNRRFCQDSSVTFLLLFGETIMAFGADGVIRKWNVDSPAPISEMVAHEQAITGAQLSECGGLVTSSLDGSCKLWDAATGELWATLCDVSTDPSTSPLCLLALCSPCTPMQN